MTTRTSDFTGADNTAWPISSGNWTHTTDIATVSSPNNQIDANRGRARVAAATTAGAKRSHHASNATFQFASAEVRVLVESRINAENVPSACLALHVLATSANSDRYEVRYGTDGDTGKDIGLGLHFVRVVGGVTTRIYTSSLTGTFDTPKYLAFRAIKLTSEVLLQFVASASPITSWDGAHSQTDNTSGLWDAVGGTAISEFYEIDPTAITSIFWDDFSTTDIQPILTNFLSSGTTYSPTITPGAVTVAPNFIASGTTVYSPSVSQVISTAAISATALYAPAAIPGEVIIGADYLASATLIFAPQVTQEVQAQAISATLIFSPQVTQEIQAETITGTLVYAPGVAYLVAANLIAGTVIYTPATFLEQTVAAPAISGALVYTPNVEQDQGVSAPAIASTLVIYAPTIFEVATLKGTVTASDVLAGTMTATSINVGTLTATDVLAGGITISSALVGSVVSADSSSGTIVVTDS